MQDFGFYFRFGWDHIISKEALDHQLFIAALISIYLMKDWKQVLILVTAFTIGHSLTLALSILQIVQFNSKWVEFLVACTIIVTAISNLYQKKFTPKSVRVNYFLALGFGLIHGMGFANNLTWMIAKDQSFAASLFGFNVGLEAGQIAVVLVFLSLSYIFVDVFNISRREWVIFLSGAIFSLALIMALERFPIHKKNNNEKTSAIKHNNADYYLCNQRTEYTKQCCL